LVLLQVEFYALLKKQMKIRRKKNDRNWKIIDRKRFDDGWGIPNWCCS
jgi:hypothetical protein